MAADRWARLVRLPPVAQPEGARAAVLVPLYQDDDDQMRVVLTKRPDHMRTHAGDVVFPGGQLEDGEAPVDTALRESWEEIGLPVDHVDVLGGLDPVTTRDPGNVIVPVVARIDRPAAFRPDPAEVELVLEPPIDELLDEDRWQLNDFMGHGLWVFQFPEGVLWGATAFMVRDLLTYVR